MTRKRWINRTAKRPAMADALLAPGNTGAPRSVQRLLALVDTSDPAFADIAGVLREYARAGGELDEEAVRAAVRLGRERHERRASLTGHENNP